MATASNTPHARILIIEDDPPIAALLEFMLNREGLQVIMAADGNQAQSLIATLPQPPDLVLLDLMLPFIDGFELLDQIHNNPAWRGIPAVVLSAKSQEQDIVRAFNLGAADYVVKPFQTNELIARIRHQLTRRRS
ncbi:MAG: response regulator [Gammaproteobacteria bacterium]|nr:response regulator [Gammaproteobacteria bacterium]